MREEGRGGERKEGEGRAGNYYYNSWTVYKKKLVTSTETNIKFVKI